MAEVQRAAPEAIFKGEPGKEVYCKICDLEIGKAEVTHYEFMTGIPTTTVREWVHVASGLRHCHPVAVPALETDIAPGRSYVGRHNTRALEAREAEAFGG